AGSAVPLVFTGETHAALLPAGPARRPASSRNRPVELRRPHRRRLDRGRRRRQGSPRTRSRNSLFAGRTPPPCRSPSPSRDTQPRTRTRTRPCSDSGHLTSMPLVQRARHHLHFETLGDPHNPPLLLIMGLALSSRAWDRLPELMSRRFHVLVFDNRGTGRSARVGIA